jgi:hypothetical protein
MPTTQNAVHDAAFAPNGDLVFVGDYGEPIDLGLGLLQHTAGADGFAVRVLP